MEETTAVDRSKVTIKLPKRYNAGGAFIEWQEFKVQTRRMPNGYSVTLAAVFTGNRIVFGASACAPDDYFVQSQAENRSMGRARQRTFEILTNRRHSGKTLLENHSNGDEMDFFYYDGPDDREQIMKEIREFAGEAYGLVAINAERQSILREISEIRRQHDNRFDFKIEMA